MIQNMKELGLDKLTTEQRIHLALEIWESLGDATWKPMLSAEQQAELIQRDAEMENDVSSSCSWQEIRDFVEKPL
ncbi:MAG: addiction module protein [Planctomycetia bacterium]|nr:addiction module protein [Planctomycetia bacterium]